MKDYCENEMDCICGKEGCCKEEERPLCNYSMMSMHNTSCWNDMKKMHEKGKKMWKKDDKWGCMMPQMPMGMGMPMMGMPMQPVGFMMMCCPIYDMNMCMDDMDDCMDPMDDMDDYNVKCKCSCKKTK